MRISPSPARLAKDAPSCHPEPKTKDGIPNNFRTVPLAYATPPSPDTPSRHRRMLSAFAREGDILLATFPRENNVYPRFSCKRSLLNAEKSRVDMVLPSGGATRREQRSSPAHPRLAQPLAWFPSLSPPDRAAPLRPCGGRSHRGAGACRSRVRARRRPNART